MGVLQPSMEEIKTQCDAMEEALKFWGIPATIWLPEEFDLYQTIKSEKRGMILNVLISENPTQRTLYNLGWLTEFKGKENTLVYIPCTINGAQVVIKDGSVIEFQDRMMLRVNSVNTKYMYGVFYVLNCSPFVQENKNIGKKNSIGASTLFLNPGQNELL